MIRRLAIGLAAAGTALCVVLASAWATSDPATAVRIDSVQLTSFIRSAQATLVPDLQLLRSDVQRRDAAAVKRDIAKLRGDSKKLLAPIQKSRRQLVADINAAQAAGIDLGGVITGGGTASSGPLAQVRTLQKQLRAGLQSSHSTDVKVTKTKHAHAAQHVHTAKHTHFVKHTHTHAPKHPHKGKHPHPHKPKK